MYAFFRSRTLGYDVYPEDYFLPNFPWPQYGGLWVCDEARFARSEVMNALSAQALRCITSEGASPQSSSSNSPTSPFTGSGFNMPAASAHMRHEEHTQLRSFVPATDGTVSGYVTTTKRNGSDPILNMGGLHATSPQPGDSRPSLSLLTEVGRRYPGFPTPLSPTLSAKELFPSPTSGIGSGAATPRLLSPAIRSVSPVSIDGSEICGPLHRCYSHGFKRYSPTIGLIDSIIAQSKQQAIPPAHPSSEYFQSLTSSPCTMSPRTAMLKSMLDRQALQGLSHNSLLFPASGVEYHPRIINSTTSSSQSSSPQQLLNQCIHVANGTETSTTSPISPSGTVLVYTSHRPVGSGLLGVRPLSETQVAEYRFWSPCGRRGCAFGCGGADEGEWAAAKRLFRDVKEVNGEAFGCDVQSEDDDVEYRASEWAGRRMVKDWGSFLMGCEREGVARF